MSINLLQNNPMSEITRDIFLSYLLSGMTPAPYAFTYPIVGRRYFCNRAEVDKRATELLRDDLYMSQNKNPHSIRLCQE